MTISCCLALCCQCSPGQGLAIWLASWQHFVMDIAGWNGTSITFTAKWWIVSPFCDAWEERTLSMKILSISASACFKLLKARPKWNRISYLLSFHTNSDQNPPLGIEIHPPKFMSQEITEPIADRSRGMRARRYHVLRQVHDLMSQKRFYPPMGRRFYPLFADGKEATKKTALKKGITYISDLNFHKNRPGQVLNIMIPIILCPFWALFKEDPCGEIGSRAEGPCHGWTARYEQ